MGPNTEVFVSITLGAELTEEVNWIFLGHSIWKSLENIEWLHVLVNNNEFLSGWFQVGWSGLDSGVRNLRWARTIGGVGHVFLVLDGNSRGNRYLKARGATISS